MAHMLLCYRPTIILQKGWISVPMNSTHSYANVPIIRHTRTPVLTLISMDAADGPYEEGLLFCPIDSQITSLKRLTSRLSGRTRCTRAIERERVREQSALVSHSAREREREGGGLSDVFMVGSNGG